MSDQQDGATEIKGPLVFSCIKCRTIVGDSYSLFHTNEEFKTITLSASSNIQRTNELYTSNQEHDNGSSYFCFICLSCHQPLGRYYVTTNTHLDTIREKFTFDIDSISSYEVGKAQHGKSVEPEAAKSSEDVTTSLETAEISDEVLKIQHVVVDLAQRLLALENQIVIMQRTPQSMLPPQYHPSSNHHLSSSNISSSQHHPHHPQFKHESFSNGGNISSGGNSSHHLHFTNGENGSSSISSVGGTGSVSDSGGRDMFSQQQQPPQQLGDKRPRHLG